MERTTRNGKVFAAYVSTEFDALTAAVAADRDAGVDGQGGGVGGSEGPGCEEEEDNELAWDDAVESHVDGVLDQHGPFRDNERFAEGDAQGMQEALRSLAHHVQTMPRPPSPTRPLSPKPVTAPAGLIAPRVPKRRLDYCRDYQNAKRKVAKVALTTLSEKEQEAIARTSTVRVQYSATDAPVSSGAWTGPTQFPPCLSDHALRRSLTKEEVLAIPTMRYVPWNGVTPIYVVEKAGIALVYLAGRPSDPEYMVCAGQCVELMRECGELVEVAGGPAGSVRRGDFDQLTTGVSFGGGRTKPGYLKVGGPLRSRLAKRLRRAPEVQRVVRFGSDALRLGAPRQRRRYSRLLCRLKEKHKELSDIDLSSAFAATTFNVSQQVVSIPHRDHQNLGPGWCSVTALGSFDHTKGGHLVLWELGLIIEFPAGSTVLIPSALVTHSNTVVAEGEVRMSITQYTAAGLFRWAAAGYRTMANLFTQDQKRWSELVNDAAERAKAGLAHFMTLDELETQYGVNLQPYVPM